MSTPTTTFHWDAIKWLREDMGLATEIRPSDRVGEPDAPLPIEGFLVHPSRASAYAYSALCVLTVAVLLSMLGMPALPEATEAMLHRVGQAGLLAAVALLIVAWVVARRSRSPALVQLHPAAAPATRDAVTELHQGARGATTWIVAERTPSPEVLEAAAALGVRCFARTADGRFVPLPAF